MDAGRHSGSSLRPLQLAPCRYGHAVRGLPKTRLRPLFPGLIGLGRVASFLPCVPLLRGPRTWFRVAV
ncbi:hypothetical protein NDU88_005086 [Pleurodeles waltl]|uniref:Uncharacterized protein n=1 Tax=Pleurodeles waltl TaxID=8319 RepID=A0AAV7TTB5_PLEWA|nr:hypothetical protein NDU88_005086 [Pleurodeles waltl]